MKHTLIEYIHLGGYVMYILVILNILGLSIMLWKFIQIRIENKKTQKVVTNIFNIVQKEHSYSCTKVQNEIYHHAYKYLLKLDTGMNTIKIIATIAPILGLLGTVIGVLQSFETISTAGFSQGADLFASGISLALITTIGGLIVSLPHYIGFNYLTGSFAKLESKYEGMIISRITRETLS